MAHFEQEQFIREVRDFLPDRFSGKRVLEVGSGEIRGSVRRFFTDCDYLGVDVEAGSSVDRVCPGQLVDEPSESFDVVLSCECFEHNPYWRESFINMVRMLKPGGLMIISCALTGRQEHGTARMNPAASLAGTDDYAEYYKNLSVLDLTSLIDLDLHLCSWFVHGNIYHKDLYLVGIKRAPEACPPLAELHARVRRIRREKPLGPLPLLTGWLDFQAKRLASALLGERGFHNLKYALRKGPEKLLGLVVGKDRVERYRQQKRARKNRNRDNIRRS